LTLLASAGGLQMADVAPDMQNIVNIITALTALIGAITTLINQAKAEPEEIKEK